MTASLGGSNHNSRYLFLRRGLAMNKTRLLRSMILNDQIVRALAGILGRFNSRMGMGQTSTELSIILT